MFACECLRACWLVRLFVWLFVCGIACLCVCVGFVCACLFVGLFVVCVVVVVRYVLFVAHCVLFVVCCSLSVVRGLLLGACFRCL